MGRKKGVGVDCAMLPAEMFEEAGEIPHLDIPYYPEDWYCNTTEELYLERVEQYACAVAPFTVDSEGRTYSTALPGDLALFRWGDGRKPRPIAHGAIVVVWPQVLHAWKKSNIVEYAEVGKDPLPWAKFVGIWRLKRWCE
jgi:cell wall-associated NlpC family hydrolase